MGDQKELSPQAMSDLGFDAFNYQIAGRLPPTKIQADALRERLVELALDSPEVLLFHTFHESLASVVGYQFGWAIFGAVKTAYGSRPRGAIAHASFPEGYDYSELTWDNVD